MGQASLGVLLAVALMPAAAPAIAAEAAVSARAAEQALLKSAAGKVQISTDAATGSKSFLRVKRGGNLLPKAAIVLTPAAKTAAFFAQYGSIFGIRDAAAELAPAGTTVDGYGFSRSSYQQMYKGLPVFGAVLRGHVDRKGRLTAVNGTFVPDLELSVTPEVNSTRATAVAVRAVQAQQPSIRKSIDLTVRPPTLMVYRTNLTRGLPGENYLVYEVEVTNNTTVREFVYVDAHTGKIVDQITGIQSLKNRRVYEASFDPDDPDLPPPAWKEGDPRPALNPAHEDEIAGAGESYNFYFNLSNGSYRSWDGNDATQYTVNNDPTITCPNANWNGISTNYCTGTSADDVVVHEWTHAYTQETSNLIYQYQSGALNESYSDIFGEVVDLINNRDGLESGAIAAGDKDPRSQDEAVCSDFGSQTPSADDSVKWLVGEDAFAFAPLPPVGDAAIRDMWNPQCFGDPGHTSSEGYHCGTSDAGGVHINSGVPNRAFAYLVDGGTIELRDGGTPFASPVTVQGIGLTKAAHIHWRANSTYNGPASGFQDNADSLEQACTDLIGVNLPKLVSSIEDGTSPVITKSGENDDTIDPVPEPSGEIITAQNCTQVTAAIRAVEMRRDVTEQCGFQPLLDPAPAPACGDDTTTAYFSEDWENGMPPDWSTGQMPVSKSELDTREWFLRSGDLPANPNGSPHAGSAMFQENRRDLGNCSSDDESGKLWLESPMITVPAEAAGQLVFEHWVATEANFDGGNVLISINGGPYEVISGSAYVYNGYNGQLTSTLDGNTNPKAGEEAFTGTDAGTSTGGWGESQIDLAEAGVSPGDSIQLRWELGQDGCNGAEGWYLDTVELFACEGGGSTTPGLACAAFEADVNATNENILFPVPSVSTATVSGEGTVVDVNVRELEGTHTYMGDVSFDLASPGGTSIELFNGGTADCGAEAGISAEFEDSAESVIGCTDWTSGDAFQPFEALSAFNGEDPNGDWTLTINDAFPQDEGTLQSWSVEFCVPDFDNDGIPDAEDNCTEVANPTQCDTNGDGYGNHCDADLDNDGGVTQQDLGIFRSEFGKTGGNLDADLNCDGGVTQPDLGIFRSLYNKPPGPSGLAGN